MPSRAATPDFYSYDPLLDRWKILPLVPPGREGKLPKRGARGATDGNGRVFSTKGNNTLGFWRYTTLDSSWRQMPDVPLGNGRKKVKAGTDMVYVDRHGSGYLYLLKGYYNEFYRYNLANDTWVTLRTLPGSVAKWKEGSWLVHDGADALYAHKAVTHEFFRYDLAADSWCRTPLTGMPFQNRQLRTKKSKDGGCAAWYAGTISALKGGNTQEFWRYFADADTWSEIDTLPQFGPSLTRKKVKNGADIASFGEGTFYALKGNKTLELWRYVLAPEIIAPRPRNEGVMGGTVPCSQPASFAISPNPLSTGFAVLSYSLPDGGAARLTVCDIAGRVVLVQNLALSRTGKASLDLRPLPAGVYLVRTSTASFSAAQKLVVQR